VLGAAATVAAYRSSTDEQSTTLRSPASGKTKNTQQHFDMMHGRGTAEKKANLAAGLAR